MLLFCLLVITYVVLRMLRYSLYDRSDGTDLSQRTRYRPSRLTRHRSTDPSDGSVTDPSDGPGSDPSRRNRDRTTRLTRHRSADPSDGSVADPSNRPGSDPSDGPGTDEILAWLQNWRVSGIASVISGVNGRRIGHAQSARADKKEASRALIADKGVLLVVVMRSLNGLISGHSY